MCEGPGDLTSGVQVQGRSEPSFRLFQWEAGSFPTRRECAQQDTPVTSMRPLCLCLRPTRTTVVVRSTLASGGTGRLPTLRLTRTETILPQVRGFANEAPGGGAGLGNSKQPVVTRSIEGGIAFI